MIRARTRTRFGGTKWFNSSALKADGISPTLALDFKNNRYASNGASRPFTNIFNYARNSTATYFGSDGILKTAAVNELRYAYDPETLSFKGALFEAQSTNTLTYSQDMSNAIWAKADITVTPNYDTAPDGTTTSNLIAEGGTGTAIINQSETITASSTNTFSVFLKYEDSRWVRVLFYESANSINQVRVWVDLLNKTLGTTSIGGTGSSPVSRIQVLQNGWVRVSITGVIGSVTAINVAITTASGDASTARNINTGYQMWGAQFENLTFMTSYIPTTSTTVTRVNDTVRAPLTNFQSRATVGTYKSYDGTLITANIDEVRYHYSAPFPSSTASKLTEASVTNNASSTYGATNMTYTAASATGPDNVANSAGTATTDAASNNHFIGNSLLPLVTIGQYYCLSAFVKYASGSQYVQLAATASAADLTFYINYDITTGVQTFAGAAVVSSGIEPYRDGWYRIWGVFQAIGGGGGTACVVASIPASGSSRLASFTGTNSFYIYGMQHELGTGPTSYIPTVATAVTRAADVIEPGSSNLLRLTSQISNAAWSKTGVVATDGQTDPYGNTAASLLTDPATTNTYLYQAAPITGHANKTYTFSVWLKSGTKTGNIAIYFKDGSSGSTIASATPTITSSWQRFSVTGTFGSSPVNSTIACFIDHVDNIVAGDYYMFGPQLEEGASASPLLVNQEGAGFANIGAYNWLNNEAGTMFIDMSYEGGTGASYPMLFRFDDTTSTNRINIYYNTASNLIGSDGQVSGSQYGYTSPKDASRVDSLKYAQAYRTNSARAADEATLLGVEDTAGTVPHVYIASVCNAPSFLNCYVKNVRYYPLRVSNPELQRITTL